MRQNRAGSRPQVSAIRTRPAPVVACDHLRLTAPFSWLERHEGWLPLDYAVKLGAPDRWQLGVSARIKGCLRRRRGNPAAPGAPTTMATGLAGAERPPAVGAAPSARPLAARAYERAYRSWRLREMVATLRQDATLAASTQASVLLLCGHGGREADPWCCHRALRVARGRRIPVVYDTDDLLLAVPEHTPAGEHYRQLRPILMNWIRAADHVTVANAMLAAELAALNSSISILPSFIDADLWGISEIPPPDDRVVSVGYWGSASHVPDLKALSAAFRHLKQRYGRRIRFQFMGCYDPELLSLEDVSAGDYVPSYAEYARATRQCRLDVAIAPLADNRFNRCKSPIKFFEYSIRGACGIYADLEPYQAVVRPGENGFLIGASMHEWVGALEELIDKPELRCRMARQAQADVLARHTLEGNAWRWRQAYQPLFS